MPQVIIHVPSSMQEGNRTALVEEAREAITTVLKLDTLTDFWMGTNKAANGRFESSTVRQYPPSDVIYHQTAVVI